MNQQVFLAATFVLASSALACGGSEPPPATPPSTSTTSTTTETSTTSTASPASQTAPAATAPTTATTTTPAATSPTTGAKEGEACGDGVMGRPSIPCATGLTCDMTNTAPAAPAGAQGSARAGKCKKAM